MNALDTLIELSGQMELEHAEESRSSLAQTEPAKPACFTPKEKRVAFVHPAQLPNGKQVHLLKTYSPLPVSGIATTVPSARDVIFVVPRSSLRNLPKCS